MRLDASGVPEPGVERRTGVLHRAPVLAEDQTGEQPCVGPQLRGAFQRLLQSRLCDGVVVQEQDPLGAPLERASNADVVAACEAEVRSRPDQLHLREAPFDREVGAVGRAVVDADRGNGTERGERGERVVAAVPVENDCDELHADRMKWAIEPAPACRSQPLPISVINCAMPG